jgi:hypothetical protein
LLILISEESEMKKLVLLVAVLIAVSSAQALYIDFEEPTYILGAINTQGEPDVPSPGWWGSGSVQDGGKILGSGQELYSDRNSYTATLFYGNEYSAVTTLSYKFTRAGGMNNFTKITANGTDIGWLYQNANNGLGVYDPSAPFGGTTVAYSGLEYTISDDFLATMIIDFGSQTYDITYENLTAGGSASVTDVPFYNGASVSLATAQAGNGRIIFDPSYHDLWVDDISIVPEPATMVLLGLGSLLIRRKKA